MPKLEDIRKKREELEKQAAELLAQEKAESEKKLREHADGLLAEAENLGYKAWTYEAQGEDGLKIKVTKKRTPSSAKNGRKVLVTTPSGEKLTFDSAKKACEHFGLDVGGDSGKRVLERNDYKVAYVKKDEE